MKIYRLLILTLILLMPSAHAQSTLDRLATPNVRAVVDAIIEVSPITLGPETWAPYSLCLIDAMKGKVATSEDRVAHLLIRYINTFDRPGSAIDGDTAARINNEGVVPCLSLNPIYAIEEKLVNASTHHEY